MCSSPLLLTIFKIINILVAILKIALPLIIIITTSLDIGKASISGNSDELMKQVGKIPYKFVAAALILFLPTIIYTFCNLAFTDLDYNNIDCLFNVTDEMIANAKTLSAKEAVEIAQNDQTLANVQIAERKISMMESGTEKTAYTETIKAIKKSISDEKEKVRKAREEETVRLLKERAAKSQTYSGSTYSGTASGNALVDYARSFVGKRYVYGGPCGRSMPDLDLCYASGYATDCSGFASGVYYHFGIDLRDGGGATTHTLIHKGKAVSSIAEAQPGDLIFYGSNNHHVAIYAGNNMRVHAWNSRDGVVYNDVGRDILAIRRIIE